MESPSIFSRIKNTVKEVKENIKEALSSRKTNQEVKSSIINDAISGIQHQVTATQEKGKKIKPTLPKEHTNHVPVQQTLSIEEKAQLQALNQHIDHKLEEVEKKYQEPLKLSNKINASKKRIRNITTELKNLFLGEHDINNFDRLSQSASKNSLPSNNTFLSEATYKKSSSQTSEMYKLTKELEGLQQTLETTKEEGLKKIQDAYVAAEPALEKLKNTIENNILVYKNSLDLEEANKRQEIEEWQNNALESLTIFGKILDFILGLIASEWLKIKKEKSQQGKEILQETEAKLLQLKQKFEKLRDTEIKRLNGDFSADLEATMSPIEKIRQESENAVKKLDTEITTKQTDRKNAQEIDDKEQEKMKSISDKFSSLKTLMTSMEQSRKALNLNGKLSITVNMARNGKTSEAQESLIQDVATITNAASNLLTNIEQFRSTLAEVKEEIGADEFLNKTFGHYIKECELLSSTTLEYLKSTSEAVAPLIEKFSTLAGELNILKESVADKIVQFNNVAKKNDLPYKPQKGSGEDNTDIRARNEAIYQGYSPSLDYNEALSKWKQYKSILAEGEHDQNSPQFVTAVKSLIKNRG